MVLRYFTSHACRSLHPVVQDRFPHSDIPGWSRLLAPDRGFSQPITSFFGYSTQGIHVLLLIDLSSFKNMIHLSVNGPRSYSSNTSKHRKVRNLISNCLARDFLTFFLFEEISIFVVFFLEQWLRIYGSWWSLQDFFSLFMYRVSVVTNSSLEFWSPQCVKDVEKKRMKSALLHEKRIEKTYRYTTACFLFAIYVDCRQWRAERRPHLFTTGSLRSEVQSQYWETLYKMIFTTSERFLYTTADRLDGVLERKRIASWLLCPIDWTNGSSSATAENFFCYRHSSIIGIWCFGFRCWLLA